MKKLINLALFIILTALLSSCYENKQHNFTQEDIKVIPIPVETVLQNGSFTINKNTQIIAPKTYHELLRSFAKTLQYDLSISDNEQSTKSNYIKLIENANEQEGAYELTVTPEGITVNAGTYNGFLYGLETIKQLLPANIYHLENQHKTEWTLPAIEIKDAPRFKWRGLMLDLSRHFFEKEYILKTIDRLAMHKMNTLHLHLVDDQGWRLEIKKYPKLTKIGAWRVDQEDKHWNDRKKTTADEKATYGGFLTQEEIKEIVAYAKEKGITVVPEIEMPAHVASALAAYPHLSCTGERYAVPSGGLWPIVNIYCAGKESTFEFLEDVLLEVFELFPSKYIHIGGDEATKTNWKKCADCQKRIKTEGLKDAEELQSYFIKRMEKFINEHNRVLIGWDEILEGGLAPNATVMSWRGMKGGIEASKQGHDVVMSPGTHCYFDAYQGPQNEEPLAIGGYTPISKVYQFDPIAEGMSEMQANHVLGGQANLWAEYIPTISHSEYMIFPRLAALSEVLWSPKQELDWKNFSNRLETQFKRYDNLGINYAKSAYLITYDTKVDIDKRLVTLTLQNEFPGTEIRYVLNGEELSANSTLYQKPIELKETTTIQTAVFKDGKITGKIFSDTINFHKAVAKKVEYLIPYNKSYQGAGATNMVNTLRGTTNFHDGKWQAWYAKNMEVIIDMEVPTIFKKVTIGALNHQGPDIYLPVKVEVFVGNDKKNFKKVGEVTKAYEQDANPRLHNFAIDFAEQKARYIKVFVKNYDTTPQDGAAWLFVDEIVVE